MQLLPPGAADPRGQGITGLKGLTIEIVIDERAVPERDTDVWAHDAQGRDRYEQLNRRVRGRGGEPSPDWLAADAGARRLRRPQALIREATNVLSSLTHRSFTLPGTGYSWVLDNETTPKVARSLQQWWPSFATGPSERLSDPHAAAAPVVPKAEYRERIVGAGSAVEFPSDIDELLDGSFALPAFSRIAFARACELGRLSRAVWPESRSLSMAAAVFAIEALAATAGERPERCEKCGQVLRSESCSACRAPIYGLTTRFRQFVEQHAESTALSEGFATRLYNARSELGHSGMLLRDDEFDWGFTAGGNDSQQEHGDVGFTVLCGILGNWLVSAASGTP